MCPLSLLLALAVTTASDAADRPVIDDKLHLFSERAVKDATKSIREMTEKFHLDLFIETTKEGPAATQKEKKEWFACGKRTFRHKTLDDFATDQGARLRETRQAEGASFSGIYVVVVEEDGKREVGIGGWPTEHLADSAVSWVKRDALRKTLEGTSGHEDADNSLREFLTLFDAQQQEITEPLASPLGTREALLVAGTLVGVWLLLQFLRWRANLRVGPGEPEPVAIYQPAMMGTLFGVPAAFWVNDELFRVIPPEVPPAPARSESFSLPPMPTFPAETHTQTPGTGDAFSMPPDPSDLPPSA